MNLTFRSMNPDEALELKKLARKSFGPLEALFVRKPKTALVAVLDEKIVGGFDYSLEMCNGKKIGFPAFFFTDPAFQGQGIGKRLCEEGIRHLWAEGCDMLVTFIKDDNVNSWGLFEKNGFVMASLSKLANLIGLAGALKLNLNTTYGLFAIAHDFYIALPDEKAASFCKKEGGAKQITAFILLNLLFLLPSALQSVDILSVITSGIIVFSGVVLAGYIGTLFSRRKWSFRFVGGGALMYIMLNIIPGVFSL